jgi:alpha-tubulin suppressor-like RCC1 family protein
MNLVPAFSSLSCYSTFVTDSGKLLTWGMCHGGQLPEGHEDFQAFEVKLPLNFTANDLVSYSCGLAHNLALTLTGHVIVWGDNNSGQLGRKNPVGEYDSPACPPEILKLPEDKKVKRVKCSGRASFAITEDGKLYFWGDGWRAEECVLHSSFLPSSKKPVIIFFLPSSIHSSALSPALLTSPQVLVPLNQ